jgi:hypothetical protein
VVRLAASPRETWTPTSIIAIDNDPEFRSYDVYVDVPDDADFLELSVAVADRYRSPIWIDPNSVQIDVE